MASGIDVDTECVELYNDLKRHHNYHYLVFKIENRKTIVLDSAKPRKDSAGVHGRATPEESELIWNSELLPLLKGDEPRYVVYDMHIKKESGAVIDQLTFILWNPDDASVKDKMIYSSSTDNLKRKLTGLSFSVQANYPDDLSFENVKQELLKKKTSK